MDWKAIIGTVVPTVGSIVGKLLGMNGIKGEDCAVVYKFASNPGTDDDSGCEASFVKRNGKICLFNKSNDENSIVTLSIPKVGDIEPQTILVEAGVALQLEEIFQNCANYDSTRLMISGTDKKAIMSDSQDSFHACASGANVPVDGKTSVKIGTYLNVVCSPEKAVFTSANHIINKLRAVNFHGSNDQRLRMLDVKSTVTPQGENLAVVYFPSPFAQNTFLEIDVEADIGGLKKALEEQKGWCKHLFVPTKEEATAMKSARRI